MLDYKRTARKIADSMRIKQKDNPGIALARKKYGGFVDRLLKRKSFTVKGMTKGEQKIVKELSKFRYGPLVYKSNGKYKVKTKTGEVIRIAYSETDPRCVRLAKAIRDECWRRGSAIAMVPSNDMDSRTYYRISPEDSLVELPKMSELIARNIDVRIFVGDSEDPRWSHGLEKRLKLSSPSSQKIWEIMDRRKVRWCIVGFPVKRKSYIVPSKQYEKVYIDSLKETFSTTTLKLCKYYRKALEGGNRVRITAKDGTDLTFSIKGRPILVSDGVLDDGDIKRGDVGLNIPDGEVFLAPLEHSANGKICFDYVSISGFGFVKNLWITFKNGRVVDFKSNPRGTKLFKKFLDSNTGEKDRIAELGIGTNRTAKFIGTTIVDEKIFGSVHIAIGNNTGTYHGKNKASSHLDMIKIMKGKQGNLYVDGKLVMKNGMPVK